eukprot:s11246_g1.t1
MKRLRDGALKLKAGDVLSRWQLIAFPWSLWTWRFLFRLCPLAQADWLQKTAEEIRQFGVDEVSSWVRVVLEAENYDDEAQEITGILKSQKVKGTALLKLTFERLVDKPYNIVAGPAEVLAKRIAAVSAPPTAAGGFQDDLSATEFIQELASAEPQDLGEGVQVFNLK